MYGSSSFAYWNSSIKTGGGNRWRKSSGSLMAISRFVRESRDTLVRSSLASRSRRVVFPTCLGPVTITTGNIPVALRTTSSSWRRIYIIEFTSVQCKVRFYITRICTECQITFHNYPYRPKACGFSEIYDNLYCKSIFSPVSYRCRHNIMNRFGR